MRKRKRRFLHPVNFILAIIFIITLGIFIVYQKGEITKIGYLKKNMEKEKEDLEKEINLLTKKTAILKSSWRIEKIAKEELGLTTLPEGEIVYMDYPQDIEISKQKTKNER